MSGAAAEQVGTLPAFDTTQEIVVLHLGCNHKRTLEALGLALHRQDGEPLSNPVRLVNLDMNPRVEPDLVCELGKDRIDLPDDSVDLVIANHVLEHIGRQGEVDAWLFFWAELYRVMKPDARVQFECPYFSSLWAWADPTHVRAISEMTFLYLNQDAYRGNRNGGAMPDYRPVCDFVNPEPLQLVPDHTNAWVRAQEKVSFIRGSLIARKPFRPYWEDRV
jgi:SAM-dependent methyltransferase